ncbi:TniQ family protein [Agrobacterium sp. LAD9]|uniref:TniQ family protein n=1 Tax=Agrobacterium sp. LAD9 TaxID=2055153 RepID=UPI001864F1A3|nr:TniQ family protein [Agrobacterium sp. LAD9]
MTEPSTKPWPLHPQPRPHEDRRAYVRRLAETYGADYHRFCRSVLGLSASETAAIGKEMPEGALQRLASGTSLPTDKLRDMQYPNIMNDAVAEMRAFFETDEGQQWFDRCFGRPSMISIGAQTNVCAAERPPTFPDAHCGDVSHLKRA